jgi:hypothetical protein
VSERIPDSLQEVPVSIPVEIQPGVLKLTAFNGGGSHQYYVRRTVV